jgi:uncharacterized membrane protein YbhN (UPF0104 family)
MEEQKNKSDRQNIYRLIRSIFFLFSFIFIIFLLVRNLNKVDLRAIKINYHYLLISLLLLIAFYVFSGLIYYYIVKKFGFKLPIIKVLKIRILSDFGRYIPGKVWFLGGRIYFFGKEGEDKMKVLLSVYIELILLVMSGFFLGILFIGKELFNLNIYLLLFIIILLTLLALNKYIIVRMINLIKRLLRKEITQFDFIKYVDLIKIFCLYLISWLVVFLAFYCFVNSLINVSVNNIFFLGGAMALSWLIGFLVLIAPSGMGVREGTLYYLLIKKFTPSSATLISVLSRIWLIIAEIATFFIIYGIDRLYARKKK